MHYFAESQHWLPSALLFFTNSRQKVHRRHLQHGKTKVGLQDDMVWGEPALAGGVHAKVTLVASNEKKLWMCSGWWEWRVVVSELRGSIVTHPFQRQSLWRVIRGRETPQTR